MAYTKKRDLDALREYLGVTLFTWSRLDNLRECTRRLQKSGSCHLLCHAPRRWLARDEGAGITTSV